MYTPRTPLLAQEPTQHARAQVGVGGGGVGSVWLAGKALPFQ